MFHIANAMLPIHNLPGHITSTYLLFPSKTLTNNHNFKSTIVLKESPLVKDEKTVRVSDMLKGTGANTKNSKS